MFRLAETHLIAAEALIKRQKAAEAVPFINAVRRRAAWPGKQAAMEITEAQATMDFIMEERERELAAEMFRWFDLKRWGNLVQRVKNLQRGGCAKHQRFPCFASNSTGSNRPDYGLERLASLIILGY